MLILYVSVFGLMRLNIVAILSLHDIFVTELLVSPSALLYSAFGVVIEKTRGAEDDLNTVAAGTMTGMLYKCTGRGC